jgi:hypothetical protein
MNNSIFKCSVPVVFIIFNRPNVASKTFEEIRKASPEKLLVISDGPRNNIPSEREKVNECRDLVNTIDWECEVIKIYSDVNLGCMRRIVTGLDTVFNIVDKAIILEDDCMPSLNFFRFMEWGLKEFQNDPKIGMISGSNLIAHEYNIEGRNGFSSLINIWGWGTWKSTWTQHNPYVSIKEVQMNFNKILKEIDYNFWQRIYWKELLKFTIHQNSTWDFQLQYSFFKLKLLSVFPSKNLINNIGFDGNGTHTNIKPPLYVMVNKPKGDFNILQFTPNYSKRMDINRDKLNAKIIWHFNIYSAFKLKVLNIFRFLR